MLYFKSQNSKNFVSIACSGLKYCTVTTRTNSWRGKKGPLVTHQLFSLSQLKIQDVPRPMRLELSPLHQFVDEKIDRLYFFIRLTPSPPPALFQKVHTNVSNERLNTRPYPSEIFSSMHQF